MTFAALIFYLPQLTYCSRRHYLHHYCYFHSSLYYNHHCHLWPLLCHCCLPFFQTFASFSPFSSPTFSPFFLFFFFFFVNSYLIISFTLSDFFSDPKQLNIRFLFTWFDRKKKSLFRMFLFPGKKGQGHVCLLFYHLIRWEGPVGWHVFRTTPCSFSANLNINNPHSHKINLAFIAGMACLPWRGKKTPKQLLLYYMGQSSGPMWEPRSLFLLMSYRFLKSGSGQPWRSNVSVRARLDHMVDKEDVFPHPRIRLLFQLPILLLLFCLPFP